MAQSPERSFPEKVLRAHTLAGKAHKDGAKPLTRLGGAVAVGAIGVGTEILIEKGTPFLQEKYKGITFDTLSPLLRELLEDGVVGAVYAFANKQLGEALPKLKLAHFATSTVGTIAVNRTEGLRGKLGTRLAALRGKRETTQPAPASEAPSAPSVEAVSSPQVEKPKRSLLDYVNPVTALAADEARMAFVDWLEAYKAVSAGTEEEFVNTHKPKDEKEPTLTKETTIIYLGNDQRLASALETVSGAR